MLNRLKIISLTVLLIALFSVGFLATPEKSEAEVVSIEGIKYDVNYSLEDNLKLFIGKKVYVTLDSGKTFAGNVKEVGNHLMWLEQLDGKEFFYALIRINSITAIDTRFRDLKR